MSQTHPHPPGPVSHRRRGFSLLEILIVVGIIAALVAILTIALSVMSKNAKTRQTRVALENAMNLQREYELANGTPGLWKVTVPAGDDFILAGVAYDLRRIPKNRQILEQMSTNAYENVLPKWDASYSYPAGTVVLYTNGKAYRASVNNSGKQPDTSTAEWSALGSNVSFPILLDAWGKPLHFGGRVTNLVVDPESTHKYYGPAGSPPSGYTGAESLGDSFASPDGRPFWFSAGPDGDYSTHDDNLYSFQN